MKMKFFWIPARDSAAAEGELNAFLATRRIVQMEKAFTSDANGPGWSLCVEWLPAPGVEGKLPSPGEGGPRVDYKEVLDEDTFRIFAALRTWRKERAAADGVPVYTVASNEQLAAIARERIRTKAALAKVEGFGAGRMAKYGEPLLAAAAESMSAAPGEPLPAAVEQDEDGIPF